MLKRAVVHTAILLTASACGNPAEFSPPPETYSESQAMIEGVAGQRTIATIDSTFFGRNLPLLGRQFIASEYSSGSPVAILSNGFWTEHFQGRPDVIGSELEVGGVVRQIVGVMPQGVDVPPDVTLWIPRE